MSTDQLWKITSKISTSFFENEGQMRRFYFVTTELFAVFETESKIIFFTAAFPEPGTLEDHRSGYMWRLSQPWIKAFVLNRIYVKDR